MRKTISALLALILVICCSMAVGEGDGSIIFHNIPWLSNADTVIDNLEEYLGIGYTTTRLLGDEGIIIKRDEELHGRPFTTRDYSDQCMCTSLSGSAEGKIAGYVIKSILFTYAQNGNDSQLVSVKVDLVGSNYNDLSSKLTKVNGVGKEGIDEEGLKTMIWYGDDNSCVLLYSIDGDSADLFYGRLDAEEIINAIKANPVATDADPDDVSGL